MVSSRDRRRSTRASSAGSGQRAVRLGEHRRGSAAPAPRAGRRARRSTARSPRPPAPAAAAPRRGRRRGRPGRPAGSRRSGRTGEPRWTTKPRSGLSKPMPSAEVATSALTRLASRSASAVRPVGVLGLPGVGGDRVSALPQEGGDLLGRRDRERVDDARARQLLQVVGEPGQPVRRVRQPQHAERQALPVQRPAQHQRRSTGSGLLPGAQLLGDVGGDPGVGGGGGRQHRDAGRQFGQHGAQPAVVGTEVVAPVGDAVRLVDHQQTGGGGQLRQHLVAEVRVVQPLGADQQDVDLAGRDLGLRPSSHSSVLAELIVRARMPARAAASTWLRISASSGETITVGPAAALAQQRGGHEVHRRLAPAGALHDQRPALLGHQRLDRPPLVLAQPRCACLGSPTRRRRTASASVRSRFVHAPMQPDVTDKARTRMPALWITCPSIQ